MTKTELAVPEIRILDYETAKTFYCDKLGFEIDFEHRHEPGFPVYMGLKRGSIYFYLSEHRGNGEPGNKRGMVLLVDDIETYYEQVKSRGTEFKSELEMQFWGTRNFICHDPFDNYVEVREL